MAEKEDDGWKDQPLVNAIASVYKDTYQDTIGPDWRFQYQSAKLELLDTMIQFCVHRRDACFCVSKCLKNGNEKLQRMAWKKILGMDKDVVVLGKSQWMVFRDTLKEMGEMLHKGKWNLAVKNALKVLLELVFLKDSHIMESINHGLDVFIKQFSMLKTKDTRCILTNMALKWNSKQYEQHPYIVLFNLMETHAQKLHFIYPMIVSFLKAPTTHPEYIQQFVLQTIPNYMISIIDCVEELHDIEQTIGKDASEMYWGYVLQHFQVQIVSSPCMLYFVDQLSLDTTTDSSYKANVKDNHQESNFTKITFRLLDSFALQEMNNYSSRKATFVPLINLLNVGIECTHGSNIPILLARIFSKQVVDSVNPTVLAAPLQFAFTKWQYLLMHASASHLIMENVSLALRQLFTSMDATLAKTLLSSPFTFDLLAQMIDINKSEQTCHNYNYEHAMYCMLNWLQVVPQQMIDAKISGIVIHNLLYLTLNIENCAQVGQNCLELIGKIKQESIVQALLRSCTLPIIIADGNTDIATAMAMKIITLLDRLVGQDNVETMDRFVGYLATHVYEANVINQVVVCVLKHLDSTIRSNISHIVKSVGE